MRRCVRFSRYGRVGLWLLLAVVVEAYFEACACGMCVCVCGVMLWCVFGVGVWMFSPSASPSCLGKKRLRSAECLHRVASCVPVLCTAFVLACACERVRMRASRFVCAFVRAGGRACVCAVGRGRACGSKNCMVQFVVALFFCVRRLTLLLAVNNMAPGSLFRVYVYVFCFCFFGSADRSVGWFVGRSRVESPCCLLSAFQHTHIYIHNPDLSPSSYFFFPLVC